jgi:hypothetical protein
MMIDSIDSFDLKLSNSTTLVCNTSIPHYTKFLPPADLGHIPCLHCMLLGNKLRGVVKLRRTIVNPRRPFLVAIRGICCVSCGKSRCLPCWWSASRFKHLRHGGGPSFPCHRLKSFHTSDTTSGGTRIPHASSARDHFRASESNINSDRVTWSEYTAPDTFFS